MDFPGKKKIRFQAISFALLTICIITYNISFSQPVNDNCSNAPSITIPNGGFGQGTFTSATYDISQATVEAGETFAPAILVAGLNKKSIWFKFSIPTIRTVRVILAQSGTAITAGDAGFAVYKTSNCLPANADISTKLTPIGTFGETYHPCVDPGDYLVQVTSNNNANGLLYIQLQISDSTNAVYDHPFQAYDFGLLSQGIKSVDYSVDCQSIEDSTEVCSSLGNSTQYRKTTWQVFKMPTYYDYLALLLASPGGSFSNGTYNTIGYRLYRGDVRTTAMASLTPVTNCDSFYTSGYFPDYRILKCSDLEADSVYSLQLFFKNDFYDNIRLAISLSGTNPTQAPEPILSNIPPSNNLGVLSSSAAGVITNASDYFGCNSQHINHPCPPSLPANGVGYAPFTSYFFNYNLSTFFTFTLSTTSSLDISTSAGCWSGYIRLYKQGLSNNCNTLDTSNIVSEFQNSTYNINCLDPGNYTLQVMGSDTLLPYYYYDYYYMLVNSPNPLCILGNLGTPLALNITARAIHNSNKYSLNIAGAFDSINTVSGIMQPFADGGFYTANSDTLGCGNTVLPIAPTCSPTDSKAIYREFVVADSGIVDMYNYSYYSLYNFTTTLNSQLYQGDANALSISQNAHDYPSRITGLNPASNCLPFNITPGKACLVPGTYTYVTFGDKSKVDYRSQPFFQYNIVNTVHDSPANAEDLGDILNIIPPNGGSMVSSIDHFSCRDNVVPINGYTPCTIGSQPATKAIYRQFYLNSTATISIYSNSSMKTLFAGKITDGIAGLTVMPDPWQCFYSASSTNNCLPPGWYTLISYGGGPSYENPLQDYDYYNYLGAADFVTISACPGPKYNRPYKAAIDTLTNQPFLLQWAPRVGSTNAYPITDTTYILYTEHYNCAADTPFSSHPIVSCDPSLTKVTYYVFKTTQESYVQINTNDLWSAVYAGDVRLDSMSFATATPIQPCVQGAGNIQLCRLQPGTYTLVVFANGNYGSCSSTSPSIYIDKTGFSRFDHANKAYDFGSIPPDSVYHNGKTGDVNPLDAGRAPSNDFFYCTTGSRPTDPVESVCNQEYNANIYSGNLNNYLYPAPGASGGNYLIPRRNLWYTFVLNNGGNVRIKVSNKTANKTYQYRFAVYKSDVNGSLPFSAVVSSGQVDSSINQGLSFIVQNPGYYWCFDASDEVSFYRDPCSSSAPERYYILVENTNSWPSEYPPGMYPNSQVEVSILLDSANSIQPKFDHYFQASDIGTSLAAGSYTGQTDNFSCATLDPTDPISGVDLNTCHKTLWYKFSPSVTGHVRYRVNIGNGSFYDQNNIQLFRQLIPGDSTSTGLQFLPNNSTYDNSTGYWSQNCVSPGTYYIILPGCGRTNEYAFPEIQIIEETGDFCSNAVSALLNGPGTTTSSVIIDCHTIGTDYGEFNSTLSCPNGGLTVNYKTSWFKIDITGTDTLDVTTYLTENTNAQPSDIKYRLMNGNCSAMQERSCVQDAQTQDTYKCLLPGSYWVQVFTPVSKSGSPVIGTIDLHLLAVHHADTCAPIVACFANANFIPQFDCNVSDAVSFTNYSTYGSAILYNWNFGYNGQTSTAVSPQFIYPSLPVAQTYTITLTVQNTSCSGQGVAQATITIPPRPVVNLGADTSLCNGGSIVLHATSYPGTTYLWQDGSSDSILIASTSGLNSYFVAVTYNGCTKRDTINVNINPLVPQVLYKYMCNNDPIVLDASRGLGESHHWNTGAITSSISIALPGIYWDDMLLNGCTTRDSFIVSNTVYPLGNDLQVCFATQPFVLNASTPGAINYTWQDGSTGPVFNAPVAGLYWVDISFGNCSLRDTIILSDLTPLQGNLSATICEGQLYTLPSGNIVSIANTYSDTIRSTGGCDSLINTVSLTVQFPVFENINATICPGQTYTLPWGLVVSTPNVYYDTLHYSTGCDSVRRSVNLIVQTATSQAISAIICVGQTYTLPWGIPASTTGTYRDTLRYLTGCDSVWISVNLAVQSPTIQIFNPVICAGQNYTLPWGVNVSAVGTYRDTLHYTTGCDSVITVVNLVVQSATTQTFNPIICAGQTYTLPWGTSASSPGVYRDTLRYTTGCDSVWRIVNLVVQSTTTQIFNPIICEGQTYTLPWGTTVNSPGVYRDTLHYTSGCDSVWRIVNLVVQSATTQTFNPVICAGQTYTLPWGATAITTGTYQDTLHYTTGCDSIWRIVNLAVQSATTQTFNPVICAGQTYTLPWGTTINSPGVYRDTLHYTSGCDSVWRIINLVVETPVSVVTNPTICSGQSYTLPWGATVITPGTYYDTLRSVAGCDSIRMTVNLTILSASDQFLNAFICYGSAYTLPWGTVVSSPGVYRDTLHSVFGCDSIRTTVNLVVQSATTQIFNPVICAGQTYTLPWGTVVSVPGVYRDTLHYTTGCDSVRRTVNLVVQSATTQIFNPVICAGQTYTLPWGTVVSAPGVYQDTLHFTSGCDSAWRIVNLVIQSATTQTFNPIICTGQTYTLPWGTIISSPGSYQDTLHYTTGCDSVWRIVTLVVQSATTQTFSPAICISQTYTLPWGTVVSVPGVYRDTLHYTTGCDSVRRIVTLVVQSATTQTFNPIICMGQTYMLPWGIVVSSPGVYLDTLHYTTGCDSVWRIVNLVVQSAITQTFNPIICSGQNYTLPWGVVVNSPGVYRDTLHYTTGCDSVWKIVNLVVQSATTQTFNPIICTGQTYMLPWGIVVNTPGVYRDTLHYTTGCDSVWRIVTLVVQSATTQTFNPVICTGGTYTLPWGAVVISTGVYRDTLHYTTGCDSVWRIVNLVVQSATTQILNPVICAGQNYTLPWGAIVNLTGFYRDTLHYTSGCDSVRRVVNLTVQSPSSKVLNPVICEGGTYTLPWGMIVSTAGTYRDTLHYASGCDSVRRTVNLRITSAVVANINAEICSDETYSLPWGVSTNSSGIYKDTLRTAAGCDSLIRIINLTVDPAPSISISKSNDINCTLGITNLKATGGISYTWTPPVSLNNATIYNPVASPTTNTWYRVIVTSDKGCTSEDSIQVKVVTDNMANAYLVPNAFTPNGDGKNDCFGVQTWGAVTNFEFSIFSRWGERVFYTKDPKQCWDGRYKGVEQSANVFVYQIKAKGLCGEIYRKGTFVLIR
jgi:gliding motility-associated-like protein